MKRIRDWVCLGAGLMDAGTGVMLVVAPLFTYRLMGLSIEGVDSAFTRFIGAFVFSVGGLYLFAFREAVAGRRQSWNALWLATAWIRLWVGVVTLGLISAGGLEFAWISVPVSDLALAVYQWSSRERKDWGNDVY
ncbi:hypothetical protein [Pelagicoccus sp. SDUM812003]|uniref:hypothetical protein n=1 Tax=Pelagicoccus sp. SDUM812003 TaxID=3041267 RepID=UPI00280DBDC7|nr:hypothetical protein [Pelagicoccus sp. SDUM812003]MDQ8202254.1 hypothetical protein [Pelagicoccus sp. SDUM812003]